jgi:hypothetical protein
MNAVAVRAHRNFAVTRREALPMHAGLVLAELVRAQAGIKLPHIGGIGVTAPAQLGHLFAINLAFPPTVAAHSLVGVVAGRIAAVATGTG